MNARLFAPVVVLSAFIASTASALAQPNLLGWHDGIERGAESARASGKPLFVVFRCVR